MVKRRGWGKQDPRSESAKQRQRICKTCNGIGWHAMVVGRGDVQQEECDQCGGLGERIDRKRERLSISGSYPSAPVVMPEDWCGPVARRLPLEEAMRRCKGAA